MQIVTESYTLYSIHTYGFTEARPRFFSAKSSISNQEASWFCEQLLENLTTQQNRHNIVQCMNKAFQNNLFGM